jgi:hypothetical protein
VPAQKLIAGGMLLAALWASAPVASADPNTAVTPASSGETVYIGIEQAARGGVGPGTGPTDCKWTQLPTTIYVPITDSNNITWQLWSKVCTSTGTTTYWIPVLPPGLVVPYWRNDLVGKIPKTEPVWSPLMPVQYVSWPTYIWLNKTKTADVVLNVRVPSANATLTARATKVVFNPGIAEDAVTCDGIPLKREDCFYTYRQTSKSEENLRYKASVSVTWDISWTATTGASGTLPSYVATFNLPIAVAKIQTVNA